MSLLIMLSPRKIPNLLIGSEEEYRLYIELRRLANDNSINENDSDNGFRYKNSLVTIDGGYKQ